MNLLQYQQLSAGSGGHGPNVPVSVLRTIRGDMWPAIGNPVPSGYKGCQWGPRPGSPDDILAMDYYDEVDDSGIRAEMRARYKAFGWKHAVTGPMIDTGYHGMYPQQSVVPSQDRWNQYLDRIEEWWNDSIYPIHFIHPDNWMLEDMDRLAHLYRQPRAQELLRMIVPTGWEPTQYDWKAAYWAAIIKKVLSWFAGAPHPPLVYLHTVSDTDAPTGNGDEFGFQIGECAAIMSMSPNELCDHLRVPRGTTYLEPSNGTAWDFSLPYLHGWLIQNGPYRTTPDNDPTLKANFGDQFDPTVPHSIAWHWAPPNGNAGWHPRSAWGPQTPPDLIGAEQTAFTKFWRPSDFLPTPSEQAAIQWGNVALSRKATGALDGCSLK